MTDAARAADILEIRVRDDVHYEGTMAIEPPFASAAPR